MFSDESTHQGCHPLYHDDKIIAAIVHVLDIPLAEVAPVQNEAHIAVPICLGFLQHELQLGDVDKAAGILLVEQRLAVGLVIGNGIVEDGKPLVLLCMTELDDGDVPGLAILVGGVIGDVDPLPMVSLVVPPIEKRGGVLLGDGVKKRGDLCITVDPHDLGEQGMVECIIGVVLGGIVLTYNRVRGQIQQQSSLLPKEPHDHLVKAIVLNDVSDDQIRTDSQATASRSPPSPVEARHPGSIMDGSCADCLPMVVRLGILNFLTGS